MKNAAGQVSLTTLAFARAHKFHTVYLLTAGSGSSPAQIEESLTELRQEIESRLVALGLMVARNAAGRVKGPPSGGESYVPVRQPEEIQPEPDIILFVAIDLAGSPRKLTFWFVSPVDYRARGVYANPQERQVLELK